MEIISKLMMKKAGTREIDYEVQGGPRADSKEFVTMMVEGYEENIKHIPHPDDPNFQSGCQKGLVQQVKSKPKWIQNSTQQQ